ncbi:hypothetical protein [Spirosoma agri]|uniref:Uncharacterized protein n=1 Tax=Spirosoma agri TaxID=1987381 RepID=A0A6M0IEB3_9BACT|nr:hypothetical protein [Spirosoma agri]NEU66626.1 hypothetical protein [Spirosoma agri]
MHYVSVFTLFALPVAKGFASLQQATDYLQRAHNDQDVSPLGIYDATTGIVIPCLDDHCSLIETEERLIVRLAQRHLERLA